MKFGLLYETQRPFEGTEVDWNTLYKETLEQCQLADQVGFDNLWFVEHHFLTGFSGSPCPEVLFGALSQITKQIRIGFGVSILPHAHPVRIAERVAMVDQLTDGRVEFGTGRSNAYEQMGLGVDPRDTREMWEESLAMLPKIWQSDEFSWEGKYWQVPPRRVLPKPFQKPHPRMYLACTQTESFKLAAERGIGVLSSASYATSILAEHVKVYREHIKNAKPVGAFVTNFWGNNVHAYCGTDNDEARTLAADSMKAFFGPDKPYIAGRIGAYEELLEAWGGVPDHLQADFGRWIRQSDEAHKEQAEQAGISLDSGPGAARAAIAGLDPNTLADRGVIIAGDPDSCAKAIQMYEDIGVDQVMMIIQTETIPHEKVMSSIELFGKEVFPRFRAAEKAKAEVTGD
ncbi:MAG: LLM class flavin-dependent oxidoreductase [Chloroflexi bacterium]|nr:LLM class flavin-dependent oxidoreductase [Chloroflexota bacterium]MDA1228456.1 LLM class flavin-dependent oxidoreductase [Chloroflexota bacterium]